MATKLRDKIKSLPPARRKKIEERTAELIAEEMSLRELRKAHGLAQERLAEILGIGQEGVSRLEKRSDLLISTLRSYVEAMGGSLSLVAEFPERQPVIVSGLASMETTPAPRRTPRRTAPPRAAANALIQRIRKDWQHCAKVGFDGDGVPPITALSG